MQLSLKRAVVSAALAATASMGLAGAALAGDDGAVTYEITVTNLTRGQAFTPLIVVAHTRDISLFTVGEAPLPELATLAEGGDTGPLGALLGGLPDLVGGIANGTDLIMAGGSETVTLTAPASFNRISVAGMLIPTNDSFLAVNGVRAPRVGGVTRSVQIPAYDAGSEPNDENCDNIPGPVCMGAGPSPDAGGEGYVHISGGIAGIGDLGTSVYDWRNPVAQVDIVRVETPARK